MGCLQSSPLPSHNTPPQYPEDLVPKIKHKILLLGTHECGKTTVLTQLRMLYGKPFKQSELLAGKPHLTQVKQY